MASEEKKVQEVVASVSDQRDAAAEQASLAALRQFYDTHEEELGGKRSVGAIERLLASLGEAKRKFNLVAHTFGIDKDGPVELLPMTLQGIKVAYDGYAMLQQRVAELNNAAVENSFLKQQTTDLQKRADQYEAQFIRATELESKVRTLTENIQALEGQVQAGGDKSKEVQTLREHLDTAQNRSGELELKNAALSSENALLKERVTGLENQLEDREIEAIFTTCLEEDGVTSAVRKRIADENSGLSRRIEVACGQKRDEIVDAWRAKREGGLQRLRDLLGTVNWRVFIEQTFRSELPEKIFEATNKNEEVEIEKAGTQIWVSAMGNPSGPGGGIPEDTWRKIPTAERDGIWGSYKTKYTEVVRQITAGNKPLDLTVLAEKLNTINWRMVDPRILAYVDISIPGKEVEEKFSALKLQLEKQIQAKKEVENGLTKALADKESELKRNRWWKQHGGKLILAGVVAAWIFFGSDINFRSGDAPRVDPRADAQPDKPKDKPESGSTDTQRPPTDTKRPPTERSPQQGEVGGWTQEGAAGKYKEKYDLFTGNIAKNQNDPTKVARYRKILDNMERMRNAGQLAQLVTYDQNLKKYVFNQYLVE